MSSFPFSDIVVIASAPSSQRPQPLHKPVFRCHRITTFTPLNLFLPLKPPPYGNFYPGFRGSLPQNTAQSLFSWLKSYVIGTHVSIMWRFAPLSRSSSWSLGRNLGTPARDLEYMIIGALFLLYLIRQCVLKLSPYLLILFFSTIHCFPSRFS